MRPLLLGLGAFEDRVDWRAQGRHVRAPMRRQLRHEPPFPARRPRWSHSRLSLSHSRLTLLISLSVISLVSSASALNLPCPVAGSPRVRHVSCSASSPRAPSRTRIPREACARGLRARRASTARLGSEVCGARVTRQRVRRGGRAGAPGVGGELRPVGRGHLLHPRRRRHPLHRPALQARRSTRTRPAACLAAPGAPHRSARTHTARTSTRMQSAPLTTRGPYPGFGFGRPGAPREQHAARPGMTRAGRWCYSRAGSCSAHRAAPRGDVAAMTATMTAAGRRSGGSRKPAGLRGR